jgi:hypothetical protein
MHWRVSRGLFRSSRCIYLPPGVAHGATKDTSSHPRPKRPGERMMLRARSVEASPTAALRAARKLYVMMCRLPSFRLTFGLRTTSARCSAFIRRRAQCHRPTSLRSLPGPRTCSTACSLVYSPRPRLRPRRARHGLACLHLHQGLDTLTSHQRP